MIGLRLQIDGLTRLRRDLDRVGDPATLAAPMERSLARLQRGMGRYPRPPQGTRYRRTGTLGRRWATGRPVVTRQAGGLTGTIGNATAYAPYVQAEERQARIHRGRWQTDADVLAEQLPAIEEIFARALAEALEG